MLKEKTKKTQQGATFFFATNACTAENGETMQNKGEPQQLQVNIYLNIYEGLRCGFNAVI